MSISQFLDKNSLHHAYLIEGESGEVVPEIKEFLKGLGVDASGKNSDFCHISVDSFKIEDARNLKALQAEKGFSTAKKIFIISANHFLLEAQNSLLKMFEEPIENTHFFLIVPDANALLKTLVSRFYLIKTKTELEGEVDSAKEFIKIPLKNRIDFIKELLVETEPAGLVLGGPSSVELDSARSKALKFLNALELALHQKLMSKTPLDAQIDFFNHFFKVREFLRMPGSSVKSLMESVALMISDFKDQS